MRRLHISLSLICLLLAVPTAALAQEAPNGQPAGHVAAFVSGLSATDLLNVREKPSPLGKTIGRLPNGALVRKLECRPVDGYEWCLVDALDVADLSGWTPARYLQALDGVEPDPDIAAERSRETGTATGTDPSAAAAEGRDARLAGEETGDPLPPGLEARFAGAAPAPLADAQPQEAETAAAPDDAPEQAGSAPEEAVPAGVPIPTPRPGSRTESPEPATPASGEVALATEAPSTTASARIRGEVAGEVPCARHVGQPMGRCIVLVASNGEDAADVTVVWPDGGTRLIEFRDGVPAGSDSGEAVRFTREGTLNMIRIGTAERFEILDALALED